MALWPKSEPELPPELQGKSPQEILAVLNEAKETKAKLEALAADKTNTDQELAQIKVQMAENQQLIEQLKANQKEPPKPDPQDPPNPWLDPDKWADQKMQPAMATAMFGSFLAAKMYFQQQLDPTDQKIFRKYEKEVDQAMQGYPMQARIIPDNWKVALNMVKGQHLQEISKMINPGGEFFSEGASGGAPPEPTPNDKLTQEEEDACQAMHWDRKAYLANRGKLQMASSEKGTIGRFTNE
jgi:hypothetical protein